MGDRGQLTDLADAQSHAGGTDGPAGAAAALASVPGMAATGFHTADELNALLPGTLPGLLGLQITAHEPGRLDAALDVRPDLLAPNGYLHAATVVGLADTACGLATRALLPEGASGFTTIELKTNFLGTARDGRIEVVATQRPRRPDDAGVGRRGLDRRARARRSRCSAARSRCSGRAETGELASNPLVAWATG